MLRRLRIQCLLIDSLCIVQDDPHDWRTESEAMAVIYGGALFTLARQCDEFSTVSVQSLPLQVRERRSSAGFGAKLVRRALDQYGKMLGYLLCHEVDLSGTPAVS